MGPVNVRQQTPVSEFHNCTCPVEEPERKPMAVVSVSPPVDVGALLEIPVGVCVIGVVVVLSSIVLLRNHTRAKQVTLDAENLC